MARIIRYDIFFFLMLVGIFLFVMSKYFDHSNSPLLPTPASFPSTEYNDHLVCGAGNVRITVADGSLCRHDAPPSLWRDIFDTYPLSSHGRERIYTLLDVGDSTTANELLRGIYHFPGFDPVTIPTLTWNEDPFHDQDWRLELYSLRFTRHILAAWNQSQEPRYAKALEDILESFSTLDAHKDTVTPPQHLWGDPSTVAFRSMVITNIWWKLRSEKRLTVELSTHILQSLEQHGKYLFQEDNFNPKHSHAITQANALYLLGTLFPDFPNAQEWKAVGQDRIQEIFRETIGEDALPGEQNLRRFLTTLPNFWQTYIYMKQFDAEVAKQLVPIITALIRYTTDMIRPDTTFPTGDPVPLTGAFIEMGTVFPELSFMLSRGHTGSPVSHANVTYENTLRTVLRSSAPDIQALQEQTRIDILHERTTPFSLFGAQSLLIEKSFVSAHENTAPETENDLSLSDSPKNPAFNPLVPNRPVTIGIRNHNETYGLQTMHESITNDVSHERAIALLEKNTILLVDMFSAPIEHTFEQYFTLFSGANVRAEGYNSLILDTAGTPRIHITQLVPSEQIFESNDTPLIYWQKGTEARFITLITLVPQKPDIQFGTDTNTVRIRTEQKMYTISLSHLPAIDRKVTVVREPEKKIERTTVETFSNPREWKKTGTGTVESDPTDYSTHGQSLLLIPGRTTDRLTIEKPLKLDLSDKNIGFSMKVSNRENVRKIDISLSTNNWSGYVTNDLRNNYRPEYDGDWMTVSLGKGELRDMKGQWRYYGKGFDWSRIDRIQFRIEPEPESTVSWRLNDLYTIPQQQSGVVVFIFDDGYRSVKIAADIMQKYGLKGNIAAIADYIRSPKQSHLSLDEVRVLKEEYGWDIVNHTRHHVNAVNTYYTYNALEEYEDDILDGAKYLIDHDLNSVQNWIIYPQGGTNNTLKRIVEKYYRFGRALQNQPEVYPFGDPLGVKTFLIEDTTPSESVLKAIDDAVKYNLSLFLTMHRIRQSFDPRGYDPESFKKIVIYLAENHIPVKTLSEYDRDNDVPQIELDIQDAVPAQLVLEIQTSHRNPLSPIQFPTHTTFTTWVKNTITAVRTIIPQF